MAGGKAVFRMTDEMSDAALSAYRDALAAGCRPGTKDSPRTVAARKLRLSASALDDRLKHAMSRAGLTLEQIHADYLDNSTQFVVDQLPEEIDIDALVARRKAQFERKRAVEEATKLVPIRLKIKGPYALHGFGDPHVDDDGTDIARLEEHAKIVNETEGFFCFNVGDTTNNWVGRLARLYASQSTTAAEAWALAEWFVGMTRKKLLWMVGGNHDAWSGAGDPLMWIKRQTHALYQSSEVRVEIRHPEGSVLRVNNRHDFSGHSQWNPVHGPMKAVMMGHRDHISVCGHKHISGYSVIKDPNEKIAMHCAQIASYKKYDTYAKDRGFRDQELSPCIDFVIDPSLPLTHPDAIKQFWDPVRAAEYLTFLRSRYKG